MDLTTPWLLPLGLLAVGALVVGTVVTGRRRGGACLGWGPRQVGPSSGARRPVAVLRRPGGARPRDGGPDGRRPDTAFRRHGHHGHRRLPEHDGHGRQPSRLEAAKKVATTLIEAQPGQRGHRCRGLRGRGVERRRAECGPRAGCSRCGAPHPSGGTPLAGAIVGSLSAITGKVTLPEEGAEAPDLGYWSSATVVLVSDGETTDEADATEAATALACAAGVHIETVGVGTAAGTTVDADGYVVHTALDEAALTDRRDHRWRVPPSPRWPTSWTSPTRSTVGSPSLRSHFLLPAHSAASRPCCSPWARPAP